MVFLQVVFLGPSASRLGGRTTLGPDAPALIKLFSILLELATKDGYYFRLVYCETNDTTAVNDALASFGRAVHAGHEVTHLVMVDSQRVLENLSAAMIRTAIAGLEGRTACTFIPGTTSDDYDGVADFFDKDGLTLKDVQAFAIMHSFAVVHTVDQEALLKGPFLRLGQSRGDDPDVVDESGCDEVAINMGTPVKGNKPRRRKSSTPLPSTPLRRSSRLNPTPV